jgi:hypothetical protein
MGMESGIQRKKKVKLSVENLHLYYNKDLNGCWIWNRSYYPNGYGHVTFEGKSSYAHRVSHMLHSGNNIKGKVVCHKCDNRSCINPSHLFMGTQQDNINDCIRKGRMARGTSLPQSKLDEVKVKDMRDMWKTGIITQRELGKIFRVSQSTVERCVNNKSWV